MIVHSDRLRSADHTPVPTGSEPATPPWWPLSGHPAPAAPRSPAWLGLRGFTNRAISLLATAVLLLLTLALGFVVILQQPPEPPGEPHWTPSLVRALATAPGNVGDVALVEAVFGLDQLPAGEKEAIFYRLTLPPGETLTALVGPSCGCPGWPVSGGVGAESVQSGQYQLRLAAPMRVQRHGASQAETIPMDTEVTLGPGDAAIYPDYIAAAEIRAAGDVPVQLVGVAIVGTEPSGPLAPTLPLGVRGEELTRSVPSDWKKLAAGPVGISLRQVTLPAGTHIGPYEPFGLEAMRIERGKATRYYFEPGADDPTQPPINWIEGRVAPLLGIRPGMRYDLTSGDDGPTELLVLIIEPAGFSAQTLAP